MYSYKRAYFRKQLLTRAPLNESLHSKRAGGNVDTSKAEAMARAKEEELLDLDIKLSRLDLALAPHHNSDKCLVCRTVETIEDVLRFEHHVDLLQTADSSDWHMILKYHARTTLESGRYIQVHKVDFVLVTIGDSLAWKLQVYQVLPKDLMTYTVRRQDRIALSVYPNVCNSRLPCGLCVRVINLHRYFVQPRHC